MFLYEILSKGDNLHDFSKYFAGAGEFQFQMIPFRCLWGLARLIVVFWVVSGSLKKCDQGQGNSYSRSLVQDWRQRRWNSLGVLMYILLWVPYNSWIVSDGSSCYFTGSLFSSSHLLLFATVLFFSVYRLFSLIHSLSSFLLLFRWERRINY